MPAYCQTDRLLKAGDSTDQHGARRGDPLIAGPVYQIELSMRSKLPAPAGAEEPGVEVDPAGTGRSQAVVPRVPAGEGGRPQAVETVIYVPRNGVARGALEHTRTRSQSARKSQGEPAASALVSQGAIGRHIKQAEIPQNTPARLNFLRSHGGLKCQPSGDLSPVGQSPAIVGRGACGSGEIDLAVAAEDRERIVWVE